MLKAVHVLLSYSCTSRCDHCFLHCGPGSGGTFTLEALRRLLDQVRRIPGVSSVAFEGGEPFLYHPLLMAAVGLARGAGLAVEAVSNAYWAVSREDAALWLVPLVEVGLGTLAVSRDELHHGEDTALADNALAAARDLGLATTVLPLAVPRFQNGNVDLGGVMFRGRAAQELAPGLPLRPTHEFDACPREELESPSRVHVDAAGNVQVCQGICMGNVWRAPLGEIMEQWDASAHPACGPLLRGGPARLVAEHGLDLGSGWVDACQCCYEARKALRGRFPDDLAPGQAYGEPDADQGP